MEGVARARLHGWVCYNYGVGRMGAIGGVGPAIACRVQSLVLEDLGKAAPVSVGRTGHELRAAV